MGGRTSHYGLSKVKSGDSFSDGGYKYTWGDRDIIDQKLWLGAEGHHHRGGAATVVAPTAAPTLTQSVTRGNLVGGFTYRYKVTMVDEFGDESLASPEATIALPAPLSSPSTPALATSGTGGVLSGGNYYYVLTAYVPDPGTETLALNPAFITASGTTAKNTITLPSLPAGATGFNLYRRIPGGSSYLFLASIPMNVATPPTNYVDNGSVAGDCDRTLPLVNGTNRHLSVRVCLGGATPTVPLGHSWKIYRTTTPGNYTSSFIKEVTEYLSEATPTGIAVCHTDIGLTPGAGSPPDSITSGGPSKVILTDSLEVQGRLPMGDVSGFPAIITFAQAGVLTPTNGSFVWVCEWPQAQVVGVRIALGRGSKPAVQSVIVDVNKASGHATPTYQSIFNDDITLMPRIYPQLQIGDRVVPPLASATLVQGDALTVDIVQAGGGTTPTDYDLTVSVAIIVGGFPSADSFDFGQSSAGY